MPRNISQASTPPPSGQMYIGGWTVLEGSQPSPSNGSEISDTGEEDISRTRKRKAEGLVSSSRPVKSPRLSESSVSTRVDQPLTQSKHTLSSSSGLRRVTSRGGSPNSSSNSSPTANTNASKKDENHHLPDKRNFPPIKTPIRTLRGSKSVPSLRQEISRSQSVSKLKPTTRSGSSSSSDSLPDPMALVGAYRKLSGRHQPNDFGGKGRPKGSERGVPTKKGANGSSSSGPKTYNASASQKKLLPKTVGSMGDDDDTIVISSDSDDNTRAVPVTLTRRRHSHRTQTRSQSSKAALSDSDSPIDLTSDKDIPTVAKSRLASGSQMKQSSEIQLSAPGNVEAASQLSSSTVPLNGTTFSRPHTHIRHQISHSAPIPLDTGSSGSCTSSTKPVATVGSLSSSIQNRFSGGSNPKLSHPRPYSRGPPQEPQHSQSLAKGYQIGNKHRSPEAVEIIDLCSDSDEAMEVDSLLEVNSQLPRAGTPSTAVYSDSDRRRNGIIHALPLPQLSQQSQYDLPSCTPSSPSTSKTQPRLESQTTIVSEAVRDPVKDVTSLPERPTFAEASLLVDAIFNHELSDVSNTTIDEYPQVPPVPPSSSPPEDLIPSSTPATSESSIEHHSNGDPLLVGIFCKDHNDGSSGLSDDAKIITQRRNADAGPSTLSATTIVPRPLNDGTYRADTPGSSIGPLRSSTLQGKLTQDPTEALVAPVSDMHLQTHVDDSGASSLDLLDASMQGAADMMDIDTPAGSGSRSSSRKRASPSSSSSRSSADELGEPSKRPINYARKTTNKPFQIHRERGLRSEVSDNNNIETQKQDESSNAALSRPVISVKEPDFSKLRANNPSALHDATSLSDAIQWPAERIPTELHDMLNRLPANYHHNPQMKYIFESMMEENTADDEPTAPRIEIYSGPDGPICPPWEFYYTNRIFHGKGVPRSDKKLLKGCGCDGPCDPNSETCACVQRQKAWTGDDKSIKGFLYNKKGKVLNPGYPIFECNDSCECSEECMNRVIQNGRQHQISICLTKGKGWGVYADEKIPRGTYLGIYSGEMLLESEAAERGKLYDKYGRTYLFDLDFYYLRSLEADKQKTSPSKSDGALPASQGSAGDKDEEKSNLYTIDAFHVGNFTRFLNHSCDPNCVITPSYVNESDLQKPTLTIFTTRDVKKGDELCFSYFGNDDDDDDEEKVDEHGQKKKVVGGPGTHISNAIHQPCLCEAPNCRGKMF